MDFPKPFLEKYKKQLPGKDFDQFMEYCGKPLRKSIRVNTLKISVDKFCEIAEEKGWELEPIPWCEEGFWIERENREETLGNSIEHFMGLFYIQEASSMIPPEILNPQPGEIVLDMAAAPGSKTTQLAAKLRNTGVLVANEPVVKRIKGLVSNLERLGAICTVVSRKEGQYYGENAVNFFDKILLDAPCTGEGTVRKDPKALQNWSQEKIEGMSRLQKQLIKAAFEALKPGGEMVYSTCTLAKEENEEVVEYLLREFEGNAELVRFELVESGELRVESGKIPLEGDEGGVAINVPLNNLNTGASSFFYEENELAANTPQPPQGGLNTIAAEYPEPVSGTGHSPSQSPLQGEKQVNQKIQCFNKQTLNSQLCTLNSNQLPTTDYRLPINNSKLSTLNSGYQTVWPQFFDSEGFFVAKIRKNVKTEFLGGRRKKKFHFKSKYRVLQTVEVELIQEYLWGRFGYTQKLLQKYKMYQKEFQVYICPREIRSIDDRVYLERRGFNIGEFLHKRNGSTEFKINHWGVCFLGGDFEKNVLEIGEKQTGFYLKGDNLTEVLIEEEDYCEKGVIALKYRGIVLGKGLLKNGTIKNQIPRYLIW